MQPIRLVIVDDHRMFRQGLVSLLEGEAEFEVVGQAASGKEALALVAKTEVDVALADFRLPDMPGTELIERLLLYRPALGIVVLTASQDGADLLAAVRAGARGYVLKLADADVLFGVIREVHAGGAALCNMTTPKVMEILRALAVPVAADGVLTPREVQVVALLAGGADNAEIAEHLIISENTVKSHVAHILDKLRMKNRMDLVAWAARTGQGINRVPSEKSSLRSSQ